MILEESLKKFNNKEIPLDSLISIKKLSKYSAIINLVNGYHATRIGNCYFYLDPKTNLIEPIVREFATNFYKPSWGFTLKPPYYLKEKSMKKEHVLAVLYPYGLNSIQLKHYENIFIKDLERVSNKSYLDTVFSLTFQELNNRQYCLFKGDPSFKKFNKNLYFKNQFLIQNYIRRTLNK